MKLFGKDLKPKLFAEEAKPVEVKKKKVRVSSTEIGATGTPIFSGIISGEEYLPELSGRAALVTYDRMRKSDATVGAALLACKLPLLGAKWFVEPASDSPEDKLIAKFVEHCLMEASETEWQDFLRQSLLMLDFGYMVFEKVFQIVEWEHEGEDFTAPKKEYIGWKKFAPRLPKTIYKWEMTDGKPGVTQILPQGGTPEIPMENLMLFVNNKEGDNYNGISILRTAYKHWYFKDNFYKLDAMGYERQALGIPTFKLPNGHNDNDKALAIELLQNIRANERQYLVYPESWTFEFADMKAHTIKDPKEAILHHDQEILKSVLAQFLNLGTGNSSGGGAKALSSDHSDIFFEALKSVARQVCGIVNKHAIRQLVDFNFDVAQYPKLTFTKIGKIDFTEYSTALQNLTNAGLLTADLTTEQFLREQFELPDKAEPTDADTDGGEEIVEGENKSALEVGADKAGQEAKAKTETEALKKEDPGQDKNEKPNKSATDSRPTKASEVKKKSRKDRLRMSYESESVFVPYRPLTFAEQKVNFPHIDSKISEYETKFKMDAKDILTQAITPLIDEFKQHIQDRNMDGVKALALPYKASYQQVVLKYLKLPYEFGKKSASSEMQVAAPATPASENDRLKMQADMIVQLHENDIIKALKLKALDVLKKIKGSEPAKFSIDYSKMSEEEYKNAIEILGRNGTRRLEATTLPASQIKYDGFTSDMFGTDPKSIAALEEIKKGIHRPVVVDANGVAIDGNHHLWAYNALGIEEIPVITVASPATTMAGGTTLTAQDAYLQRIYLQSVANEDFMYGNFNILENGYLKQALVDGRVADVLQKMEKYKIDDSLVEAYKDAIGSEKFKNYFEFDKFNRDIFSKLMGESGKTISEATIAMPTTDPFEQAMQAMANDMADTIDTITENTANLTTGMMNNQGRALAQGDNAENIHALQRSEILDGNICDFCASMDGMIVSMGDPFAEADEFHSNCRGIWVEIMKDEAELPDLSKVPDELRDAWGGTVNDLLPLKEPILSEGSLAYDYFNKK